MSTFPLKKVLTLAQLRAIPSSEIVKTINRQPHDLSVMFDKNTIPIADRECQIYLHMIKKAVGEQPTVHQSNFIRLLEIEQRKAIKIVVDAADRCTNLPILRSMVARLKKFDSSMMTGDTIKYIQEIVDNCAQKSGSGESGDMSEDQDVIFDDDEKHVDDEKEHKSRRHTVSQKKSSTSKKKSSKEPRPRANERPIGKKTTSISDIDTTKSIFTATALRTFFDAYIRLVGGAIGAKKFAMTKEFLESVNMRLYEWVRDVMSFVSFTQMPIVDDSDTEQNCQSNDIGANSISEAIELNNPGMELVSGAQNTHLREEMDMDVPEPRKNVLSSAILFYANPLRRITSSAYRVMVVAIQERLVYLAEDVYRIAKSTRAKKLMVCPALTTLGRVPQNQITREHFRAFV